MVLERVSREVMTTVAEQEEINGACDKEDGFKGVPAGRVAGGCEDGRRVGLRGRVDEAEPKGVSSAFRTDDDAREPERRGRIGGGDEPARNRWDIVGKRWRGWERGGWRCQTQNEPTR